MSGNQKETSLGGSISPLRELGLRDVIKPKTAWNAIPFQNFRVRGHCLKPLTPVGKLGSLFSTDHPVLLTWHMKPHFLTALGPCWWQYFERGERVLFAPLGLWVPEHDPEFAPRDGNGQVPLRPRAPERSGLCPGPGLALCGPRGLLLEVQGT